MASGRWSVTRETIVALRHYRELLVWQKSMDFAEAVYVLTRKFPREELFGLTSQLRRAVISIPSNIAEGQGRGGSKEFIQFLNISNGSLQEAETQLLLSERFRYVTTDEVDRVMEASAEIGRLNYGLIRSLRGRK